MFFVLSSGRSGSKTIATVLNQYADCVCMHHPLPELVLEASEYYYGDRPAEEVVRVLRETRQPTVKGKVYGEVNLQHSLIYPVIRDVFPDAQFVWLLRDGRDAVDSMFCRGWYDPSADWIPEEWQRARLSGARTGDFSDPQWEALTRFEKCCWIWKKYNLIIERFLAETPPELWRRVELNSLKHSVRPLAEFLGLHEPPSRVVVEKTNAAIQPLVGWRSWNALQQRQFAELCGADMDRWFPSWRTADGEWIALEHDAPELPPLWIRGWRFAKKAARRVRGRLARWAG